ncbi:MAG: phosphoribosylaminoimidazolesuccinocarboxamide synthase [Clostridia bacterium]
MKDILNEKLKSLCGKDLKNITLKEFKTLPFYLEGESKEIRLINDEYCVIYFKPTVYSFTSNRTGIIEGSNIPRVHVSKVLCELLKANGINHAYIDYADEFVIAKVIKDTPNIEVVVKANHTGTSKHRYYGMNNMCVRKSHKLYEGLPIKDMDAYPEPMVRFDWRNPFVNPNTNIQLADEVLGDEQADWFIDVKEARLTAKKTFQILSDFLVEKDIVIYDLCLFISEDGKTVFGEISPDCGRYRHFDLGSLDKDIWRAGGSSSDVLDKWNLLYKMIV